MDKIENDEALSGVRKNHGKLAESVETDCGCAPLSCCSPTNCITADGPNVQGSESRNDQITRKVLNVDLLVIDLKTCQRCAPTGEQLKIAVRLLTPVADELGVELRHREIIVETPEQAKENALLSSPTIRLNGRDVAQDIRESKCESCGELTNNNTSVDCREWHYRGKVYFAAPLPLLIESIMGAILKIDTPPFVPSPIKELPENLQRYFKDKKQTTGCCGEGEAAATT